MFTVFSDAREAQGVFYTNEWKWSAVEFENNYPFWRKVQRSRLTDWLTEGGRVGLYSPFLVIVILYPENNDTKLVK